MRQFIEKHTLFAYASVLAVATVLLAAAFFTTLGDPRGPLWALGLLAGMAFLAERQPVRITPNAEITVSALPVLFAAVVFGPLDAMVIAGIGLLAEFRRPYARWVIWTAMRSLAGGLAGAVALGLAESRGIDDLLIAVAAAALTDAVADSLLGAATVAIRGTGNSRSFIRSLRPLFVSSITLYVPLIAVLTYSYEKVGAWTIMLFFVPSLAAQTLYRLYREERDAAARLKEANTRLERANLSFATALVATLDARDRYTAGHSAAVAVYARDIAQRMGLSERDQQIAHLCGLVHDIGKIGLAPGLLDKPGPLTLDERRQMEKHSEIGERILAKVDDYAEIANIVRHHHERVDGNGYPDRLREREIPLVSRIIAVADAYNAMTSDRPYRDAMASRVARLRLAQAVDSQFDIAVVAAFEAVLTSSNDEYRTGVHADFALEALSCDDAPDIANVA